MDHKWGEMVDSGYFGMLVAAVFSTLGCWIMIPVYISCEEWRNARRSLLLWLFGMLLLGVAFGFAVLYDKFG